MRKLLLLVLAFLAAAAHASDLALVGGALYVSPQARRTDDAVVLVHDGRIAAVGKRNAVAVPAGARTIDCTGKVITAGFWNSHVHILPKSLLDAKRAPVGRLDRELDAMLNRWGFTTVFDLASPLDNTLALRHRIEMHEVRGPRILTVGEPIWTKVPVYVRDYLDENHIRMPTVTTAPKAAARVDRLVFRGVDGVKLFTGSVQSKDVAHMPLDIARAAVVIAHRHHLPVFAHPQDTVGLNVAAEAGVDVLAHTTPGSAAWTPEFVSRLNRMHVALIPTLTLYDSEARTMGASDAKRQEWIEKMTSQLRAFVKGGGEVLFGTDIGYIDHFDTALEFQLMAKAGMDYREILASLTTNPARRFGVSRHSGRVEVGYDADLVLLDGDPANDVTFFSRVRTVIRGGDVIYPEPK